MRKAGMKELALSLGMLALCACGSGEAPASSSQEPAAEPTAVEGAAPTAAEPIAEPTTAPTAEPIAEPAGTAEPAAAPSDVAPADACARARSCCPEYAAALPNPGDRATGEQACASFEIAIAEGGPAADDACQGALEGFRRSLEATGRDVPSACRVD